jgi:hypothetical protein
MFQFFIQTIHLPLVDKIQHSDEEEAYDTNGHRWSPPWTNSLIDSNLQFLPF